MNIAQLTLSALTARRSKVLKIWSFDAPHHLSFHLSWISFFVAFLATFAAPPLIPIIRDNLDLSK